MLTVRTLVAMVLATPLPAAAQDSAAAVLTFGHNATSGAAALSTPQTRYLAAFDGLSATAGNGDIYRIVVPRGGRLRNLLWKASVSSLSGAGTNTITVLKNGVATGLQAPWTGDTTQGWNADSSVAVAAGDAISVRLVLSAAGGTITRPVVSLELITESVGSQWTKSSGNDIYHPGGNVGIGGPSRGAALEVTGPNYERTLRLAGASPGGEGGRLEWWSAYAGGRVTGRMWSSASGTNGGDFHVQLLDQTSAGLTERLTILNNGNVGIGLTSPEAALHVAGDIRATGVKSFVQGHPTDPSKEIAYVSLEGGEAGTYTRGTGALIAGKAVIDLPEHFTLVTSNEGLTAQLTPRGQWLELYVAAWGAKQIVVREAKGRSGQFDYLVQGVRRGYETHQVIRDKPFEP